MVSVLVFPAAIGSVGRRSPGSALSGRNLDLKLSFRHVLLGALLSRGTVVAPSLGWESGRCCAS